MTNLQFHGKVVDEELHNYKLDPEQKKQWVEALRSGKYVQANGNLYQGGSLKNGESKPECCCLGVFEHILGGDLDNMDNMSMPSDLDYARTPKELHGVAQMNRCDIGDLLATMNDGKRDDADGETYQLSFAEIADFIEENL